MNQGIALRFGNIPISPGIDSWIPAFAGIQKIGVPKHSPQLIDKILRLYLIS